MQDAQGTKLNAGILQDEAHLTFTFIKHSAVNVPHKVNIRKSDFIAPNREADSRVLPDTM